jgi:hypothetical protein
LALEVEILNRWVCFIAPSSAIVIWTHFGTRFQERGFFVLIVGFGILNSA